MTMEEPHKNSPAEGLAPLNGIPKAEAENNTVPPPKPASVADSLGSRNQAKVAIPRSRAGIVPRYNRRVPRACESCRARKTKCSGDTPVCRQCRELRVSCNYPVGWKERTKRYDLLYVMFARISGMRSSFRGLCEY